MPDLVDQPTAAPTRKVTAMGLAGLLITAGIAATSYFAPGVGAMLQLLPPEIVAGLTAALGTGIAYVTKERA